MFVFVMSIAQFISTFILICNFTSAFAQSNEQLITEIRKEFQRINSLSNLKAVESRHEEFPEQNTDNGATLTGYFEGTQLVKVTEYIGLSYGTQVTEYYFKNGKIFFVYQHENKFADQYDESGELTGLDYARLETSFEGRYYFHSNQLLNKTEKGKRLFGTNFVTNSFLKLAYKTADHVTKEE